MPLINAQLPLAVWRANRKSMDSESEEIESMEEGKERESETKSPKAKDVFQEQVTAFKTRGELEEYANSLQLKRTPLADLKSETSLTNTYAGGKVITAFSGELTQGRVVILLQDNPRSERYLQCVMSGDVTRLLPHSAQLGMSEVYIHGAWVGKTMAESSQEMEMEIRVEGEEEKVWIVNREAGSATFLPARRPSEFQGRGGNMKKARRQKHMEAGLELERREKEATSVTTLPSLRNVASLVDPRVVPPATSASGPFNPSSSASRSDPNPSGTSVPSGATHYATGPEPPPTDVPSTYPDLCDIPDAVLGAHSIREDQLSDKEGMEEEGSVEHSSDASSSESSSEGEENESGERAGQDRTLFPYQRSTSTRQYSYKVVAELEAGLQKVNIFGVVTDFQPPFQTKGRDFCSIVNIIDESVSGDAFKCTFFNPNQEKLPKVSKVGNIVCFHRIDIKLFPNGVQGIGQAFSSSLCFTGRLGAKVKPLTGSMSYTFTAQDKQRVKELRLWNARRCKTNNPFARALKDISLGASTDIICQVLSVSLKEPIAESNTAVLCVWDGTRMPHRSLTLDLSAFDTTTDLHFQGAETFSEYVVAYGKELVQEVAALSPSQYICLQNVRAVSHTQYNSFKDMFTAVELRLQPSKDGVRETIIQVLTSDNVEIFELKLLLRNCHQQTMQFHPLPPDIVPSPITLSRHNQQQPLPLNALGKWAQTPAKYLCIVKVLGIKPESVEEIVQLRCPNCKHQISVSATVKSNTPCPKCMSNKCRQEKKQQLLEPIYFFQLKLADETGHVTAYASGQQAANFLCGFPPAIFFHHPQQRINLLEHLYRLTGGNDPFDTDSVAFTRPWVEVCLVSTKTSNGNSSCDQENVTYHLFDTVLQSNVT